MGDHVLVDWRGAEYPAVIVGVEGPAKFHVHYDGYSEDWDETVAMTRIRGRSARRPARLRPCHRAGGSGGRQRVGGSPPP